MPRLSRAPKEVPAGEVSRSDLFVHSMPGHLVRRLQQVAVRLFSEEVGPDITPVQYASLTAIADRPNIGQAALAAIIGYDRATIGGVIDRLEQKGWIERKADATDRRANLLNLTAAGRAAMAAGRPAVLAVQAKLLQPLSAREREDFERMCRKILNAHEG